MPKEKISLMLFCLWFCLFQAGCGGGISNPIAKVVKIEGEVKIKQTKEATFEKARENLEIFPNGAVKTGDSSSAEVEIHKKGSIKIKSDAIFEFSENMESVLQKSGVAIYKIEKDGKGFKAKTPQGVTCVLGTIFGHSVGSDSLELWVKEGSVQFVSTGGKEFLVKEGQKLILGAENKNPLPQEAGVGELESFFADSNELLNLNGR
ncbi:MAG: FecR domain-containing protein [Candidatus Riflebacteria bacterium]